MGTVAEIFPLFEFEFKKNSRRAQRKRVLVPKIREPHPPGTTPQNQLMYERPTKVTWSCCKGHGSLNTVAASALGRAGS